MLKRAFFVSPPFLATAICLPFALAGGCSSGKSSTQGAGGAGNHSGSGAGVGSGLGGNFFNNTGGSVSGGSDAGPCGLACSPGNHSVVDCHGNVQVMCQAGQACDLTTGACSDACTAAADNKQSVGCDYYATHMEMDYPTQCYAAFVANTWNTPAHLQVNFYPNTPLTVPLFTYIPSGPTNAPITPSNIVYTPYSDSTGIPPGQVAILFLSGEANSPSAQVPCPTGVGTATQQGSSVAGTGMAQTFHIVSDVPVVAYQINPYGGGNAAITGASLLLPTSVWDTNYIAVTAAPWSAMSNDNPSFNIVAMQDDTSVTLLPPAAILGGGTLPAGAANMAYKFTLTQGQQAQFSQQADLRGTIIQSTKPIGVMAGNACMNIPQGTNWCDHGEQMLPPVKALGNEYVGVMFRPRVTGDQATWHMVGTIGTTAQPTQLTYVPAAPPNAPATLTAGQVADFTTDQPFVVSSQDKAHPFMLFTYMSGGADTMLSDQTGYGDPDFVLSVPPEQYLNDYVFFTDVTYPETNLVVVRAKDSVTGAFADVTLECVPGNHALTGWQPIGNYEWTRIDLMRHDFAPQNGCSNGPHEMKSNAPFGLWVWGWGTPETTPTTAKVSYGYPAGMNVQPFNGVVIPPTTQ